MSSGKGQIQTEVQWAPKVLAFEPHPLPVYLLALCFLPPQRMGLGK